MADLKPKFYTVPQFKAEAGIESMEVLTREVDGVKTSFVTTNTGSTFKAQKDIDLSKPLAFMHSQDEPITESCLINPENGATLLGTL